MTTLDAVLRSALDSRGPEPFLTYYDLGSGERTELSLVSFANWVDKTAHLLTEEYALDEGDQVALTLAKQAPAHWVTLIWATAIWQAGGCVLLNPSADSPTAGGHPTDGLPVDDRVVLEVIGPGLKTRTTADQAMACSLHPLGLGFADPLPAGLEDYGLEVRTQPDSHVLVGVDQTMPVWVQDGQQLSRAELIELARGGDAGRRLFRPAGGPDEARRLFAEAVLGSLVQAGSAVIVVGHGTEDQLARIQESERVS